MIENSDTVNTETVTLGGLARLCPREGEVYALRCDRQLSNDEIKRIRALWDSAMPGSELIVLSRDMELFVLQKPVDMDKPEK